MIRRIGHDRREQHVGRRAAEQDAVTIRLRMRHVVGADQPSAAAAIVDNDGAEMRLDPFCPDPADDVVHSGWDRRDDEADGTDGIGLLRRRHGDGKGRCREQSEDEHITPVHHALRSFLPSTRGSSPSGISPWRPGRKQRVSAAVSLSAAEWHFATPAINPAG
jgi:hypothetical protein